MNVSVCRISVRPMQYSAATVPFVFSEERHNFTYSQPRNPGRNIDVMGYEEGLAGIHLQDEALMSPANQIVFQNPSDNPPAAYLNIAPPALERRSHIVMQGAGLSTSRWLIPSTR